MERVADKFQSTPPRGGRRFKLNSPQQHSCFNPRPHVGGATFTADLHHTVTLVSIHAPTWGATQTELYRQHPVVFQPTPPRGGRQNDETS